MTETQALQAGWMVHTNERDLRKKEGLFWIFITNKRGYPKLCGGGRDPK